VRAVSTAWPKERPVVSANEDFSIICEIEPATRPSLESVRYQIGVLAPAATSFLIPDNHLGRATVSSIAAAHEVAAMGAHPIACLNSRDRNLLGFKRDLLTAAAYGVESLLFVFGDRPASGGRDHDLNVSTMLSEARAFDPRDEGVPPFRLGVTTRLAALPAWKQSADMLFVQAGFDLPRLVSWRETVSFDGPIYAGVLVLASAAMAASVMAATNEIDVPQSCLDALANDPRAGVEIAVDQIESIRESGAFDGVHLIPVGRFRQMAERLAQAGIRGTRRDRAASTSASGGTL
jgi:5,10-methylenetetrahydrofolate reductase